jgi:hypothetical protein
MTLNMAIGAKEEPSKDSDIGIVEALEKEIESEGRVTPDSKGKTKEHTATVESVPHIPASVLPAEAPAASPAQQISRPRSSFRGSRFSTKDMAEGEGSSVKIGKSLACRAYAGLEPA